MPTPSPPTCGLASLVVLGLCPAAPGQDSAEDGGDAGLLPREELTGDWAGHRTALEDEGLSFELYYTAELFSNVSGGVRRDTAYLGNLDVLLTADMERLAGWRGGTLFLYGLGDHGDSLSEIVGDLQVVSNIEAPATFKLYEAWYEQVFSGERFSLLAGLYDVNSEFDVIPAASVFVNSAHGIGSELGNSGKNGPSIFPVTSLGVRAQGRPSDTTYLRAVVADGVPGDLDDPRRTQVRLDEDDGLLLAGEFGWYNFPTMEPRGMTRHHVEELAPDERRYGYFGKYALGVWGYTTEFDDFSRVDANGNPEQKHGTYGFYGLAEQRVYFEEGDPYQGLSAFARLGFADDDANIFDTYAGGGLVYVGPFRGRDLDRLGLAVAAARLGDDFSKAASQGGKDVDGWEVALELTYRAHVTPWLSVQPDLQYVINPGGDSQLDDAFVIGVRVVVSF